MDYKFIKIDNNILIRKDQIIACRKENDPESGDYYLIFERLGDYDDIYVSFDTMGERNEAFNHVYFHLF